MDQEREDYADPEPPPSPPLWFKSATHPGTLTVVGVTVLMVTAYLLLRYAARS